jgi:hypothetical protein
VRDDVLQSVDRDEYLFRPLSPLTIARPLSHLSLELAYLPVFSCWMRDFSSHTPLLLVLFPLLALTLAH